jgi:hypothetical protein
MEASVTDSLGPDARALIAMTRFDDDPSTTDARRVREKLAVTLCPAATIGTATSALGTKGATATAKVIGGATSATSLGLAMKIGAAALVMGLAVGTTTIALRQGTRAGHPTAVAPIHAPIANAPMSRNTTATATATAAPTPTAMPPNTTRTAHAIRTTSTVASSDTGEVTARRDEDVSTRDRVADEARLLRAANDALASGDGARAMARIDEHASRFPGGTLAVEREAARVHALCALGKVDAAHAAASAFAAAHPRSPLAPSVRATCAASR